MQKLLIADCNEDFRLVLAEALQDRFQVFCCRTGTEALDLLLREPPDLLILDLMLPEIDGLTLLERARANGAFPKVLIFDPLRSSYVQDAVQRLGISYVMRKPCEISAIRDRICDICSSHDGAVRKPDPSVLLSGLLVSLGIRIKHDGYTYLCCAVPLLAQDPRQPVTKVIYPAVAKTFGCSADNVERSIRNTITVAWNHRDPLLWQAYFPDSRRPPTNADFLLRLAAAWNTFAE